MLQIFLLTAEGSQTVRVLARTVEGRVAIATVSVDVDALPADVRIDSPADGQVFPSSFARVRVLAGSGTDTVTVNGASTTRDGFYRYAGVHLASGDNTITALLTDPSGRQSSDSVVVTFTPPTAYDPAGDDDGDGAPNDSDKFPDNPADSDDDDGDGTGNNEDQEPDNPSAQSGITITSPANGMVIQAK